MPGADEPFDVDHLIDEGCKAAEEDRLQDALELFQHASQSGDPIALLNLGNTYKSLGKLNEAAQAFRASLAGGEKSAAFNLGLTFEDLDLIDDALAMYLRAAALGDHKGTIEASWIISIRGDRNRAYTMLREAAAAGSDIAAGVLGVRLWVEEHASEAEMFLRRAQDLYPQARPALAAMCVENDRVDEALAVLKKGAEEFEMESFLPLGNLLDRSFGRLEEAEAAYRMGLSLGDENSRLNLALLLRRLGRDAEGTELLESAARKGDKLALKHLEEEI